MHLQFKIEVLIFKRRIIDIQELEVRDTVLHFRRLSWDLTSPSFAAIFSGREGGHFWPTPTVI